MTMKRQKSQNRGKIKINQEDKREDAKMCEDEYR